MTWPQYKHVADEAPMPQRFYSCAATTASAAVTEGWLATFARWQMSRETLFFRSSCISVDESGVAPRFDETWAGKSLGVSFYGCPDCGWATTASLSTAVKAHRVGSPGCAGELESIDDWRLPRGGFGVQYRNG